MDVSWNPGLRCPTPEAHHRWKDEEDDVDEKLKEVVAGQVVSTVALQGEDLDPIAVRLETLRLLGDVPFNEYPEKRGEQIEWLTELTAAVMAELGKPTPEQRGSSGVASEGWSDEGTGPAIIRSPIGG
jgi:hypothetical protein